MNTQIEYSNNTNNHNNAQDDIDILCAELLINLDITNRLLEEDRVKMLHTKQSLQNLTYEIRSIFLSNNT